jgi:hypothetical protein
MLAITGPDYALLAFILIILLAVLILYLGRRT